jgi:hypothetical protein
MCSQCGGKPHEPLATTALQGLGDPRLSGSKDVNIAFLYGHFGITSTFSSDYGHFGII